MEIIIGLIVVAVAGYFIFRPKKVEEQSAAPYKVETPVVAEPTPVAEQATKAVVESIAPAKKPRAKKTTAAKKTTSKATASKATAAKKPRAKKTTTK